MKHAILVVLAILSGSISKAQGLPDGTLIFSRSDRALSRSITSITKSEYSHVAIVLQGHVYEAAVPSVQKTSIGDYFDSKTVYDCYVPKQAYSHIEVARMLLHAESQIGRKYGIIKWVNPGAPNHRETTYCSWFVQETLNASGRWILTWEQHGYDPGVLHNSIQDGYSLSRKINSSFLSGLFGLE